MEQKEFRIIPAQESDSQEILALYKTHLYGPADWNEYYPGKDTIEFDLSRSALFVMKNDKDEIVAAISIDSDAETDALPCWNPVLQPSGEAARLCVREDMQGRGLACRMMEHVFAVMRGQGLKSIHILVRTGHERAMKAYMHLGFQTVGECELFNKSFICMEKAL